jgi:hypothetical protein
MEKYSRWVNHRKYKSIQLLIGHTLACGALATIAALDKGFTYQIEYQKNCHVEFWISSCRQSAITHLLLGSMYEYLKLNNGDGTSACKILSLFF